MSDKGCDNIDLVPGSYAERAFKIVEEADEFLDEPVIYASWYNKDEQKEYASIMTPLDTYIEECTMKVITGEMSIDDWNTVVIPQAKEMGYEGALELVQKALDETLGKQPKALTKNPVWKRLQTGFFYLLYADSKSFFIFQSLGDKST